MPQLEELSDNTNIINLTAIDKSYPPQPSSADIFVECTYIVTEIFSVLLLAVGYVCNPISVAVMSRKTFRRTTMSVYLRFVAICDTVTLTTGLVSIFRLSLIGRSIFTDLTICRLYWWTQAVSTECSSWTLLAVTVERVISIVRPHKVKDLCSVVNSKVVILLILLIWSGLSTFVPFMVGHQSSTNPATNLTQIRICFLAHGTPVTLFLKNFIDVAVYGITPSIVLIVCNIVIIVSVIQSRKRVLNISKRSNSHKEGISSGPMYRNNTKIKSVKSKTAKNGRSSKETSLTFTLVCINTSYVACNLPVLVYQLYRNLRVGENLTVRDNAVYVLLFLVINFNSILNFLFYFLTGSRFRQELMNMFVEMTDCLKSIGC